MSKHTPGPWSIGEHQKIISTGWSIRIPSDGSAIAYVLGERNPELQANAKLIAAAPDLLAALKAYQAAGFGNSTDFTLQGVAYDKAVEAIAKAGG